MAAALLSSAAPPAGAQTPSLADLALRWAQGSYASPLHCTFGERALRGLRKLSIEPARRDLHTPMNRITFTDMEVADASRCFNDLGEAQPNITGTLRIRYAGTAHRATAARDFRVALEREGGFDFAIVDGQLRIEQVGAPEQPPQLLKLRGGSARLERIRTGSDAARLLADLPGRRRLLLRIEGRDGPRIELPVFDGERPSP